ncbi:hypothetical protein BU23DRAFT_562059 [Bimuria novae-zelandiae CBS 107.79]|uniref:Uncharacterized protein n=1 Tax=Bimuria novae-zelandiae CBS 107.79 TaxID=1447943 RepID=A0A6A5UGH3_9PLEO|nr:hypothetical protein BU23DRAFT_562059 [Bimuria novae-zelandiae CBS 107.79]
MISDRNVKFSRSIGPQLRDQPPLSDDNPSVDGGTHEQPSASQPEQNMPSADYLPLSGQQLARDTLDEVRSMGKDTHEIKELMVAALSAQEKKTEGTLPTASARGATTKVKSRISFGNSIKYPASGPTAQNAGKNPFSFRSLNSESRGEPKSFSFGPATTADAAQPSSSKAPPDAPFAYGSNSPVMSASRWAQDLAMKDQHFAKVEGELRNLIGMQKPKAVEDLKAKDDEIAELGEALGKAAKDLGAKDGEIAKLTKSLADAKKEVGRLGTELEQAKKIPGADASEEEVKTFIRSNPVVLSFLRSSLENQKKQLREAAESKASPAGIDQSGSQVPSASGGGLFGAAHASSASGGGLFGAAHASSASGGGLFGAAHAASAPGGGLFGASSRPSGQQNASLFTDQGSNAPAKPSLFGAARSTQSPSLFGGLGQPSTNDMQSSAGLFGGLDLSQRPQGESAGGPTGGLFGGGRAPGRISGAPRSPSPGSVFGASHARSLSSNFYASQAPSSGGVFGATQPSWNGLTPQPQTGTSIGTPRPPNFGGTVFSPGATSTGFGASQPSPTGSLFGTFSPPSAQNPPRGPTPFRAPRTSPPLQPALFNQPSFGPASAPNLVHFAREHFPPGHRSAVSHNEDENEDDNSEASYRTAFPLSNSAARIGGVFGMPGAFGEPVSAFGVGYGDAGPAGSAWHPITMGCPCAMCVEIFGSP